MDILGPIVGAVGGALGGSGVGRGAGGMGGMGRLLTGLIGGGGLAAIMGMLAPHLGGLAGLFANPMPGGDAGFDVMGLVGNGAAGLAGGGILSGILNKVMKKG